MAPNVTTALKKNMKKCLYLFGEQIGQMLVFKKALLMAIRSILTCATQKNFLMLASSSPLIIRLSLLNEKNLKEANGP